MLLTRETIWMDKDKDTSGVMSVSSLVGYARELSELLQYDKGQGSRVQQLEHLLDITDDLQDGTRWYVPPEHLKILNQAVGDLMDQMSRCSDNLDEAFEFLSEARTHTM